MARRSLTPAERWRIFSRDGFRCRYCGASGGGSKGVVLVVDHIHSVRDGGPHCPENFATSCEKCNQGKGRNSLVFTPPKPELLGLGRSRYEKTLRCFRRLFRAYRQDLSLSIENAKFTAFGYSAPARNHEINMVDEILSCGSGATMEHVGEWYVAAAKYRIPERDAAIYVWQCFTAFEVFSQNPGVKIGG